MGDSSFWLMKWNGVVEADSNSSPSIESMQPLVKYGSSISDSVVPNRLRLGSYSHMARPQPWAAPTEDIICITAWNSG